MIIIFLLLAAVIRGIKAGLMQLVLSYAGFIGGLLLGARIAGWLLPSVPNPLTKVIVVLVVELSAAMLLASVGEIAGRYLNELAGRFHLRNLNQALGAGLAVMFTLVMVWLVASALTNIRSNEIGRQVNQSRIVRALNAILPAPPDIMAQLESIISPNGFPNVFLGLEPQHPPVTAVNSLDSAAVGVAATSTVKIRGEGCGGMVSGSGFVVDDGVVVTNAHVVAGVASPEVVDEEGAYAATPIWFDPDLDVAVLAAEGLTDTPLALAGEVLQDRSAAAVIGYPGGGNLTIENGVIIDHVTASGRNIYNRGLVFRNIYEVQAEVLPGNSGGPLVAADGTVAGVIFGSSVSQGNVGYALMIDDVRPLIQQAVESHTPVSTAGCASG